MRCEIRIAGGGSYFGHVVTTTPPITVDMGTAAGATALTGAVAGNATLYDLESTNSYVVVLPAAVVPGFPNRIHF